MDTIEIYAELRTLAGSGRKVRLTRARPSEPLKNGFVLAASPKLVVLAQFHDFYPEGYTAVLVSDITEVRSGEYERHWERMLQAEGIAAPAELPQRLPLDDLPAMLTELARWGENVILECEDAEESIQDFYIGRVVDVDADRVVFANFNALGRWDPDAAEIPFDEITQVEFRTPYVKIFSRHLEGPCPHI